MSIVHGRSPDGETATGTNPVLMGYEDESGNAKRVTAGSGMPVQVSGSFLQEEHTQADAVGGVLTFTTGTLQYVEINNTDTLNAGIFTINGIAKRVPAGVAWQGAIGGTPGNTVTISGSTAYIIGRYA